jgi:antibiotic biosynthesis monooxygenase (ABM) superfamily enzyme
MPVTTIEPNAEVTTLINVFTVSPERQRELVSLLDDATERVMRHVPGFVSANIHASHDGRRVVNYAQWESVEHFQAMLADPTAREHMQACAAVAEEFDPLLYTVEASHHV